MDSLIEKCLLTTEEMRDVDDSIDKEGVYYKIQDDDASWEYYHKYFNRKQLEKAIPIITKQAQEDERKRIGKWLSSKCDKHSEHDRSFPRADCSLCTWELTEGLQQGKDPSQEGG